MVSGEASCPYCHDRLPLPGFNTLADRYPEIAELWDVSNDRTADSVLPSSCYNAAWKCPDCNGVFNAYVTDMVSGEADCAYCHDRKPLPGFNTFAVKHPDLMEEWMWRNNYALADPNGILDSYSYPVWWNCPKGSKEFPHHYTMSPANRVYNQQRGRETCPYCKGRRRKKRHFV